MQEPPGSDASIWQERDSRLLSDMAEYGWHGVSVRDEGRLPYWSFTVGLYQTWQASEVIVFGLEGDLAHRLLLQVVDALQAGRRIRSHDEFGGMLEGCRGRFVPVDSRWYPGFLAYAQWFYQTESQFPAAQLVWPDLRGRYPWDEGCAIAPGLQPVLVSDGDASLLGLRPARDDEHPPEQRVRART